MDKTPSHLHLIPTPARERRTNQPDLFAYENGKAVGLASRYMADERVDPVYGHPGLCLTVLPHRVTPPAEVWRRESPYATLTVHPLEGIDGRYRGVPYGPKARLILLYLMTEAVKTRSREIELGRSMRAWLKAMAVPICGSNYQAVADQADRIEHAILRFRVRDEAGEAMLQDSIIRGAFRPFAADGGEHTVQLSEGFYQAITRRPVPVVEGALRLLADTCMPLDLYLWLAYRLHALEAPTPVSWTSLHRQFGANTRLVKHFRPRAARDLRLALAVYPEARVEVTGDGVVLHPSPPPFAPRPLAAPGFDT